MVDKTVDAHRVSSRTCEMAFISTVWVAFRPIPTEPGFSVDAITP